LEAALETPVGAPLGLALLGPPELRAAGQALALPTRKALALLAYLALEPGLQPREKLAALLWPESDDPHARAMLRRTVAYLREAQPAPGAPLFLSNRTALGLAPGALDLDVDRLRAGWTLIHAPGAATDPPPADLLAHLARLQIAAAAYRGDLLDGFSLGDAPAFDDWAAVQRERWHRRAAAVFARLGTLQHTAGDRAGALETTARWLALDPLDEPAHRRLIAWRFGAGDRRGALQAYDAYRAVLATELGAVPDAETAALAAHMRATAPPASPVVPPSTSRSHLAAEPPWVGRQAEHMRLVAVYERATQGRAHAAIVEGEPGIGKTRLALHFLDGVGAGATVLRGRALETAGRLPYGPLVTALRPPLATAASLRPNLSETWLLELTSLLPELRDRYPDLGPLGGDDSAARTRLFEAMLQAIQALAGRGPCIFFLDDLQWADPASLDWLQYAAGRWADGGAAVLLLATLRTDDLALTPHLAVWLAQLGRVLPTTRISLGPLDAEATLRLVQALLPDDAPDRLARRLQDETAGHPLWLIETLKALAEQGLESGALDAATAAPATPPGVRAVIRARLAPLSPAASRLLTAAAVLGAAVDFEQLRAVAGLGEDAALAALDETLARRLLTELHGEYGVAHDKFREVAYAEAGAARRRVFHRRALATLEASGAPPAVLARHALAAGERAAAFHWSVAAGDQALRLFAIPTALAHYLQAQELAAETAVPPAAQVPLLLQLGRAYELDDRRAEARVPYETLLALARRAQLADAECLALNRLATLMVQDAHDLDAAAAVLATARTLAEESGDRIGLVETEWNLGQLSLYRLEQAAAAQHAAQGLALARTLGRGELIARSLNQIALIGSQWGHWSAIESSAEEARALYAALGDRAMETDCLMLIGQARSCLGQPRAGIAAARTGYAIAQQIENRWSQANTARVLALGLREVGQYGEALIHAAEAVRAARATGFPPLLILTLAQLGSVYRALFSLAPARAAHDEAQALATALGLPFFRELSASELCADALAAGEGPAAAAWARTVLAIRDPAAGFVIFTRPDETAALARAGEQAAAATGLDHFGALIGDNMRLRILYLRARAALDAAGARPTAAIVPLREAATLARALHLPDELWRIQAGLADLFTQAGEAATATTARTEAAQLVRALAEQIGDTPLRTGFLTAARGTAVEPRGPSEPNSYTQQQERPGHE